MIATWVVAVVHAGAFEVTQQSAVAGGTGHASTARTDDAAGAWFSPATLADDGGLRLAIGAAVASARIRAEGEGFETATEPGLGTPPHAYASYARGPGLVGVAVNTAFAGGVDWPAKGPLRFDSIGGGPTFFRVAPFVGLGVGLVRMAVGVHVDAGSLAVVRATDHVVEEGLATLSVRGARIGVDASAAVTVNEAITVAASYKGRSRPALEGEADFDVPPAFVARYPDQTVSVTLPLPDRLALGVAARALGLQVLADVVLTTWSVNQELSFAFADPATPDTVQVNRWRDTVAVRAGLERGFGPATLRAGGAVDGLFGAAVPVETLSPSSPDGTRVSATVGGGVALGDRFRVDGFGEALKILPRASTTPYGTVASYRGVAFVGGLTLGARL